MRFSRTIPERLIAHKLIAKPDDRGATVVTIAPPLIASETVLDEIVDALGEVIMDVGERLS